MNAAMVSMGFSRVDESADSLVVCDFATILRGESPSAKPQLPAPVRLAQATTDQARIEFAVRQNDLRRRVARFGEPAAFAPSALAERSWAKRVGFAGAQQKLPLLRTYHSDEKRRLASQAHVLSSIPKDRPSVVIAHSLGTVVVADILRRLPKTARVELLITLGSPLAASEIGDHDHQLDDSFPVDRVLRWLNVYNTRDVVTGFQGLAETYRDAVDVQVALGSTQGAHDLTGYLRTRPVAVALDDALFVDGSPKTTTHHVGEVARNLHPWWFATVTQACYAKQVAVALPTKESRQKLRIEGALEVIAHDTVRQIKDARTDPRAQIDGPVAEGRAPTLRDLVGDGWQTISHQLNDRELLPHVVTLLTQSVVPSLGIRIDDDRICDKALERLLNRIRRPGSSIADGDYVDTIRGSIDWAKRQIAPAFPLGAVLVGTGLVVLAATGVGLAVAAPAGLAGAAAITSTLAAFGPGGMTGGIATLALLTGTGAGAGGFGAGKLADDGTQIQSVDTAELGRSMESLGVDALKAALISVLATVNAAAQIDGPVDETPFAALVAVRDSLQAQADLLANFSPGSKMHDECKKKIDLVSKAVTSLVGLLREHGAMQGEGFAEIAASKASK